MITLFETVMAAMFARLQGAATLSFTADATATSAVLANVSDFSGLFAGLPVFGPGVTRGATIASLDEGASTLALSTPLGAAGVGAGFTTGFLTTGRRVQPWSKVSAQPALFFRRLGTTDAYDGSLGTITLECEAWIYSQAGKDPDAVPDEALSNLDAMVRASFAPDDEDRCTLGGLVYWARVQGRSDYSPGDLSGQGLSRLPIRITLPR